MAAHRAFPQNQMGGMRSRTHIPAGYGPYPSAFPDLANNQRTYNVVHALTRFRDRLGHVVTTQVPLDPDAYPDAPLHPPEEENQPVVGRATASRASRSGGVSHHKRSRSSHRVAGGHGGGHQAAPGGFPHGGGGRFGGLVPAGSWDTYASYGYPILTLSPCPVGTIVLPDGTCVPTSALQISTGAGIVVGQDEDSGDSGDTSPAGDGSTDDTDDTAPLDPTYTDDTDDTDNSGTDFTSTTTNDSAYSDAAILGSGGSTTPYVAQTYQGSTQANALNLQWYALAQFVADNVPTPSSLTLPSTYAPGIISEGWTSDYAEWQTYYSEVGTASWSQVSGDLTGWQATANSWGAYLRSKYKSASLPQNFPSGGASGFESVVPGISNVIPSAGSLGIGVVAVLVAAGVWILWPVVSGAHAMGI